jgi:hypothetical protein
MKRAVVMAGIVAPVLFAAIVVLAGLLRPGYNPIRQTISELAVNKNGWVQTLNFIVFGVLLIVFGFALPAGIKNRWGAVLLSGLVGLWGLGFVVIAFTPIGHTRWLHRLHFYVLDGLGLLFPILCFVAIVVLWRQPAWRWVVIYSLILFGLGVVVAVSWIYSARLILRSKYLGLYERLIILLALIWIEMLAVKLYGLLRKPRLDPK